MKHRQLVRQVGDSCTLSIIEKEAMAPRTAGGLAGGMARSGHVHRENYGFIGAKGPAPMSTFIYSPDFHLGNLGPMAHGGHTSGTTHRGRIPEYTYPEGLV